MKATADEIAAVYKRAKAQAEIEFSNLSLPEKMEKHESEIKMLNDQLRSGKISHDDYEKKMRDILD